MKLDKDEEPELELEEELENPEPPKDPDPDPVPEQPPHRTPGQPSAASLEVMLRDIKLMETEAVAHSHKALQEATRELRQLVESVQGLTKETAGAMEQILGMKEEVSLTLQRLQEREQELSTPAPTLEGPPVIGGGDPVPEHREEPRKRLPRPSWF